MPQGGYRISKQVRQDMQDIHQILSQLYDLIMDKQIKAKLKQGLQITSKYLNG